MHHECMQALCGCGCVSGYVVAIVVLSICASICTLCMYRMCTWRLCVGGWGGDVGVYMRERDRCMGVHVS